MKRRLVSIALAGMLLLSAANGVSANGAGERGHVAFGRCTAHLVQAVDPGPGHAELGQLVSKANPSGDITPVVSACILV